jgi:hypothetical protein
MSQTTFFLAVEAAAFGLAALIHTGQLMTGYQHRAASIAESVIMLVLMLGLAASLAAPRWSRAFGLGVQTFALLGTLVGIFTIIVGVGPQSAFDVGLHACFVALLVAGLTIVARRDAGNPVRQA